MSNAFMDSQQTLTKCHANTQISLMKRKRNSTFSVKKDENRQKKNRGKKKRKSNSTPKGANERVKLRKWAWGGALELLSCPLMFC